MPERSKARVRRTRERSQEEILEAGAAVLEEGGFAALTVRDVMARTEVGRSTFYLYFSGIPDLVVAILEELVGELFSAAEPWLDAGGTRGADGIAQAISNVVSVWATRGRLLGALVEASRSAQMVGDAWDQQLMEPFVRAISQVIRTESSLPIPDADELARALIRMNEAYLVDTFGTGRRKVSAKAAATTLTTIWTRALYDAAN